MVLQAISRPGLLRLAKGNNTGIKPSQVGHDSESPGPCELRESPKHESLQGLGQYQPISGSGYRLRLRFTVTMLGTLFGHR